MKIESLKQLLEDVFSVKSIHSSKKKSIIYTDVFEKGLVLEKALNNCAMIYLNDYDYLTHGVANGSFQIIFFPINRKELEKRLKTISRTTELNTANLCTVLGSVDCDN